MQPWIIIILIVVTCLTILMYTRSAKTEGFGLFYETEMNYSKAKFTTSHDQGSKVIFNAPGAPVLDINGTINSPDLYLANAPDRDYSTYLVTDPNFKYFEIDDNYRKATMPKNLPGQIPQQAINGGWWFISDPATPSVGAAGTISGPLFPAKLPPGGEWIYDLNTAQRMEELKNCRRITNCDLLAAPGISGVCGFCESTGYAVPINGDGSEKYPDDTGACGQPPMTTPAACNPPVTEPVDVDGIQCNPSLGYPSSDNTLRYYSNKDCDKLGGQWYTNGECIAPNGFSYSAACAINNAPPSLQAKAAGAPPTICTAGPDGNLTRACMISLAEGLGYNEKGMILRLLGKASSPVGNDTVALQILNQAGISVPAAVYGRGNIDVHSAMQVYTNVWNAMKSGSTALVRDSATYLVIGLADFDVCTFADTDKGPFPTMCVERAFRESGCQPAGSIAPTDATVGKFAAMTWGQVKDYYKNIYNTMRNGDGNTQDAAMTQCLGIKFSRPMPADCNNPGMERIWYSAQYDHFYAKDCNEMNWGGQNIRYPAFMGRDTNTNGWTQIVSYDNKNIGANRHNYAYMKSRTMINPSGTMNGNFDIWVDDGFRMAVNGKETYARWYGQAATHYIVPVSLPGNTNNLVEMAFNNGWGPGQLTIDGDIFNQMNMMGQMPFPESAPVIAFDFFRGTDKDRHGTVMSANFGCTISPVDGIPCITTGFKRYIHILTPLRHRAIKTYTWYSKNPPGAVNGIPLFMSEWPDIKPKDPYNPVADTPTARASIEFGHRILFNLGDWNSPDKRPSVGFLYYRNLWYGLGGSGYAAQGSTYDWHHYAVVMTPIGANVYIDGVMVQSFSNGDLYANIAGSWTPFPDFIMRQIFIGRCGNNSYTAPNSWRDADLEWQVKDTHIAFLHMYDRVLSEAELKNEMNYMKDPIYNNGPDLSVRQNEVVTMNDQYFGQNIAIGWGSNTQTRG